MDVKHISPVFAASAQLSLSDIAVAARRGYKAIINNRPDGESGDQPASAEIEAEAKAHGLGYRHIPVEGGSVSEADIDAMAAALGELDTPVLAFCRSGMRSAALWALARAGKEDADALIAAAAGAGYDLSGLRARLEARGA